MPKEILDTCSAPYKPGIRWGRDEQSVSVGAVAKNYASLLWPILVPYPETDLPQLALAAIERFPALTPQSPEIRDDAHKTQVLCEIGRALMDVLDLRAYSNGFPEHAGLWAEMNRSEVNELIRVLRRARDQAFGRDE